MYNEKVLEAFRNPKNVGEIENPDGVGTVGNASCGDIMQITLKIEKPEGIYGQIILPQGFVFEKTGLSRQKLESGVYEILCMNEVPENIIEV